MIDDAKRRGLGRGLSALLGEEAGAEGPLRTLPIELLHPGRTQPRRHFETDDLAELADSIRDKGVLQPLLVRRHPGKPDEYEIIAGERRWRAAQLAQRHDVPVVVREIGDREALEIALVENLQREDLSALEEAEAYHRLMQEFRHTQDAVAEAVGKSRSHVANLLRLLDLPPAVKTLLDQKKLTAGHARALIGAGDPAALAEEIVRRGLNVRQAERLAQKAKGKTPAARLGAGVHRPLPAQTKDADTMAVERELSAVLGLAVSIDPKAPGAGNGSVTIWYKTLEQLDDVLRRLNQPPTPKG